MKLAYLLKKFPRLSETFVLGEVLRQERLGMDVTVLARRDADDEPRHPAFDELNATIERVGAEGLNPWAELFGSNGATGALEPGERFRRLEHAVGPLLELGVPRVPKLVAEALWVHRRCQELGIEHVHVHFATESAIVAWIVAMLGGPTYSITAHAKDIYRSTVDRRVLTRLVEGSRFTVTVCDANVEHLAGLVGEPASARIRRLYNGIDLEDFAFEGGARDDSTILAVGRLVEKKGFDTLLRALRLLAESGREFRARILGDGDQREALIALRDELGLADRVDMPGAVDQGVVRRDMARATVFALPCRIGDDGNRDALPTVLLEALAVGLPTVSTYVTGVPEILAQGECGRLVESNDPRALANELGALLDDPSARNELARRGRAHAEACFDGDDVARVLGSWFEESTAPAVP